MGEKNGVTEFHEIKQKGLESHKSFERQSKEKVQSIPDHTRPDGIETRRKFEGSHRSSTEEKNQQKLPSELQTKSNKINVLRHRQQ